MSEAGLMVFVHYVCSHLGHMIGMGWAYGREYDGLLHAQQSRSICALIQGRIELVMAEQIVVR